MLAAGLGALVAGIRAGSLPLDVVEAVKVRLLDTIGAGLAGVQLGNHRPVMALIESSRGEATVWGESRGASVREAALVNSFATHSTYLEDGSRFTGGHPSSVVIPAALAEAESGGQSGLELIAAVAAGYEVFLRLGRAIYPATVNRGFQSTAVLGAVSSAAAAACLRGLSAEACGHAIGIAANLGVGLKEALKSSASQPIQVARACEGGIVAATLAQSGLRCAEAIFEKGFLPAFGEPAKPGPGPGVRLSIHETYLKRHAGCRGNHAPLDAVLELRDRHAIDPGRVKRVRILVDTVTRNAAIEPPANGEQAQFSIGFSAAVALLDGNASIFQYSDERLGDPAVQALISRIEVAIDRALDAGYPEKRAAIAEIELDDGRVLRHAVDNARGEPEWPLTRDDIEAKFLSLASPRLGKAAAMEIREAVQRLDAIANVNGLTGQLRQTTRP